MESMEAGRPGRAACPPDSIEPRRAMTVRGRVLCASFFVDYLIQSFQTTVREGPLLSHFPDEETEARVVTQPEVTLGPPCVPEDFSGGLGGLTWTVSGVTWASGLAFLSLSF